METRIVIPVKVGLALATLAVFGFAPAARADQGSVPVARIQAIEKAEHPGAITVLPQEAAAGRPPDGQPASEAGSGTALPSAAAAPDSPSGAPAGQPAPQAQADGTAAHTEAASEPPAAAAAAPEPAVQPQAATSAGPEPVVQPHAATSAGPEPVVQPHAATSAGPEPASPPSDTAAQGSAVSQETTAAQASTAAQATTVSQATPTIGSGISEALLEAIQQASGQQPPESGGGHEGALAAESNATTQLVWQLQISECIAHCAGITQYQTAEQQNRTGQTVDQAPSAAEPVTETAPEHSQAAASLTQVQLGCLAQCVGATTTTAAGPLGATYLQVLEEVLNRVLQELLGAIAAALPGASPAPAAQQNAVGQISYQSQSAPGSPLVQVQSLEQANTTVQLEDPSSTLNAALQKALGGRAATGEEAVNQTEQGIWQLQIGCLFFCEETLQYQQAAQANTTVQTIISPEAASSAAAASVANLTAQLVWQAQVGCLFWCVNTAEHQIATSQNTAIVIERHPPLAPPPPEKSTTPPGAGSKPAPPALAAGSSPAGGGGTSPAPNSGASTTGSGPTAAPTLRVVEGTALPSVEMTTTARPGRVVVPPKGRAALPAAVSAVQPARLGALPGFVAPRPSAGGGGSRLSARHAPTIAAASGTGPGVAVGPVDDAGPSVLLAVALAAFALFALSVLRVGLGARRG